MREYAKEKLRHWLRVFFHTQDSPERTALAFAVGVFIAFLPPVFWVHTLLALAVAFVFRLNRLAVLAGTYTNTPITILPLIWAEVRVGQLFLPGYRHLRLPRHPTSFAGWRQAFVELKPFVPPFVLGSLILGALAAGVAYIVALRVIRIYRKRRARAEAEQTAALAAAAAAAGLCGSLPEAESVGAGTSRRSALAAGQAVDTPENPS